MKTITFGNMAIDHVTELDRWVFQPSTLFPAITPELIKQGKTWLGDNFIDPKTGDLILSVHSYVIRINGRIILVDTCNGNHKSRPALPTHHQLNTPYLANLSRAGVRPEDVDVVMCTHLHPDHCGWNTRLSDGRWVPTFPNAKYLMSKVDFENMRAIHATKQEKPIMQDMAATFEDSILPVVRSGQTVLIDGNHIIEHEIDNGIWLENASGHTRGHVMVHAKQHDGHAVLTGDVIHHPIQFSALDLANASDYNPDMAAAVRRRIVETYTDTDTIILTGHFPAPTAGRIVSTKNDFRFAWIADH